MMHTTDRRSEGKDFGCTTGTWDVAGSYTHLDIWDDNNNYCCYCYYYYYYYYDDDDNYCYYYSVSYTHLTLPTRSLV